MTDSINRKFVSLELGGAPVITTQEIVAALNDWADDEIPALQSMLLREAAKRLKAFDYQQEMRALQAQRKAAT
jgi:hypothetical protein